MSDGDPWWKTAVIYQVYPRSFAPGEPGPVGDLEGIGRRLGYLAWLGVDAVWLSPFYPSPMADFGYDVSDYCDVDPVFGSLDDLDRLVAEAHAAGIRVVVDWVPNHTSDRHPWFLESRSSRASPKRSWYIWRDGRPGGGPPNNWTGAFTGGPAWTWDEATAQWYLHLFLPEQPDLNWADPEVVEAMHGVLRFWMDRGVDAFRADVIHGVGKDPALPDEPAELVGVPRSSTNDHESTHAILRGLRRLLDSYPGDRMMVGEVYLLDTTKVARYYGRGDELHLAFNFPPLYTPWLAPEWRQRIDEVVGCFDPVDGWPTWVLSNHDNRRHRTRYGSEARARAAAVLLLALRGTPFLYQGEELGLEDADVPAELQVDPGGRDGSRAPLPWDGSPTRGWGVPDPWLPWPPDPDVRNVEAMTADPASILHLYRRLLAARRASPALRTGSFAWREAPPGALAWERAAAGDRRLVAVNFTAEPVEVRRIAHPYGARSATPPPDEPDEWMVEVASDGSGEGRPFSGRLGGDQAVVLRPA